MEASWWVVYHHYWAVVKECAQRVDVEEGSDGVEKRKKDKEEEEKKKKKKMVINAKVCIFRGNRRLYNLVGEGVKYQQRG